MNPEREKLALIIEKSKKMAFFGGAGLSTESGIPDFRSACGIFRQGHHVRPERVVSHSYFTEHPAEFYKFYREKIVHLDAKPNPAHYALAELERRKILRVVITQNVDGLHQAAGSKNVIELHGSIYKNYCVDCGKKYSVESVLTCKEVPYCGLCGSVIRPDVVLYEEALNRENLRRSIRYIREADTLIIGGTSLQVNPAADLVKYFNGDNLVIINKDDSAFDLGASLTIQAPIGEVLGEVVLKLPEGIVTFRFDEDSEPF